jgi:hypothetical protein
LCPAPIAWWDIDETMITIDWDSPIFTGIVYSVLIMMYGPGEQD